MERTGPRRLTRPDPHSPGSCGYRQRVDADRPTFAVFDIDGVLADVSHRLHHIRRRRKRWEAFFAAADADPLLHQGRDLLLESAQQHAIVYLSGRPERTRSQTQRWLDRHGLPPGAVVLRPNRDRRPAHVVKPELVDLVRRQGRVAVVVDDDADVCDALRSAGYTVLQATWAPASEALRRAQEDEGRT